MVAARKVEEWQGIFHESYINNKLDHINKADNFASLQVERIHLPGILLSKWECYFSRDITVREQSSTPHISMHFVLNGALDFSMPHVHSCYHSGENNIWAIPAETKGAALFRAHVPYSYRTCILRDDYLLNLTNRYPELLEPLYLKYRHGELLSWNGSNLLNSCEMNFLISQIDQAELMGAARDLFIEAKVLELLSLQVQNGYTLLHDKPSPLKASDVDKIYEVKHLITSNLNKTYSTDTLAKTVGLNSKKLKVGFKQVFHLPIFEYLRDYKLSKAKLLLRDTDMSISEIGMECGYLHQCHFSNAFKKKFAMTPTQFRGSFRDEEGSWNL